MHFKIWETGRKLSQRWSINSHTTRRLPCDIDLYYGIEEQDCRRLSIEEYKCIFELHKKCFCDFVNNIQYSYLIYMLKNILLVTQAGKRLIIIKNTFVTYGKRFRYYRACVASITFMLCLNVLKYMEIYILKVFSVKKVY